MDKSHITSNARDCYDKTYRAAKPFSTPTALKGLNMSAMGATHRLQTRTTSPEGAQHNNYI